MNFLEKYSTPIKLYDLTIGNASCRGSNGLYSLWVDNKRWMTYDDYTKKELYEVGIEIINSFGDVVTTGLGFGIRESALLQKEEITSIRVFEKNKNVIDLFKTFADQCNLDISKIEIINEDANDLKNIKCDCLLLDHYENEDEELQLRNVRKIANNNDCKFFYYWPATRNFVERIIHNRYPLTKKIFYNWAKTKNIKNFPSDLNDESFKFLKSYYEFHNVIMSISKEYKSLKKLNSHEDYVSMLKEISKSIKENNYELG